MLLLIAADSIGNQQLASRSSRRWRLYLRPLHGELRRIAALDLAVLHGDQLGEDAYGNLLRSDSADVQADRGVHLLEHVRRHAFGEQLVGDARHFRAAANEPQITQLARSERA